MKTQLYSRILQSGCWVVPCLVLLSQCAFAQTPSIVPIGTLGGSFTTPYGLNGKGQVVGSATLPGDNDEHAFLMTGGTMLDLGTLGGSFSVGYAVNSNGQVVGYSYRADSAQNAFLYSGGNMLNLGTLGGPSSMAVDVNESGQVTGTSITSDGSQHAFLYSGGQMLDLGALAGTTSRARAINASGWVIGEVYPLSPWDSHAFLWKNGSMLDLGTFGGTASFPYDINDAGWVVGYATTENSESHAFLYDGTFMQDLGTLGGLLGQFSTAYAVNNKGQVAGDSDTAEWLNHGFLYSGGQMIDLGTLGGTYSSVFAMNNAGQVVGEADDINGVTKAFLWENGTMIDLESLLPPESGWTLVTAYNISDGGHILGYGAFQGANAWFLLSLNRLQNSPPHAEAGSDQQVECTGAGTTILLNGTGSTDPDGDALSYEWWYGTQLLSREAVAQVSFPLGTYQVVLRVTDPSGASAQDSTTILVQDQTAPVIQSLSANPPALSPVNKKMVPVTVMVVSADTCDPAPVSRIVSIASSEPDTGPGDHTSPDWEITGPLTANLRAEDAKFDSFRIYTLTVQSTDVSGNSSQATVTVTVGVPKTVTATATTVTPKKLR